MKRMTLQMLVVLLGLSLATTGCNLITGSDETAGEGSLPEAPAELNLVFGGYEPTDEEPGFGDVTMLEEFGESREVDADDPVATDPEIAVMEDSPQTDVYILRITWGQLENEGYFETDWSGTASAVNGAIIARKTILFERGDYIHRPRPDRRTLSWTSHTYDHLDGLSLVILDPQTLPTAETVMNTFTFETGPFTRTFTMEELAQIDTLITVDDNGNAIHFSGFQREVGICQQGFLHGRWFRRGLDWGQFRAGWVTADGDLGGHLEGMWGYDADGRNVLYGKYVDTEGNFRGLIRGTFGRCPAFSPDGAIGWFCGRWFDEDGEPQGGFRGKWKEPRGRGRGGYMRAVWWQDCPELDDEVNGI